MYQSIRLSHLVEFLGRLGELIIVGDDQGVEVRNKDGLFRGASDPRRPNSGAAAPRPALDAVANE